MYNLDENLLIIQALAVCIARKKQKSNRRERKLIELEEANVTGLRQARRTYYKGLSEIRNLEAFKLKFENEFENEFRINQ